MSSINFASSAFRRSFTAKYPLSRQATVALALGLALLIIAGSVFYRSPRATAQTSNPIELENQNDGTMDWQIDPANRSTTWTPSSNAQIEGYASQTSVNRGEQINIYVHTVAESFTTEVFRMGWYGGMGGRRMTDRFELPGTPQYPYA